MLYFDYEIPLNRIVLAVGSVERISFRQISIVLGLLRISLKHKRTSCGVSNEVSAHNMLIKWRPNLSIKMCGFSVLRAGAMIIIISQTFNCDVYAQLQAIARNMCAVVTINTDVMHTLQETSTQIVCVCSVLRTYVSIISVKVCAQTRQTQWTFRSAK